MYFKYQSNNLAPGHYPDNTGTESISESLFSKLVLLESKPEVLKYETYENINISLYLLAVNNKTEWRFSETRA